MHGYFFIHFTMKGKAKEDFEKWFNHLPMSLDLCYSKVEFKHLTDSMQWGVIVDFFDSVGITIQIAFFDSDFNIFDVFINDILTSKEHKSRQEARTKAIEKANEIYNNEQN